MPVPKSKEEYQAHLKDKLSWFEKVTQNLTGTDERLDVTNLLLIELLKAITGISTPELPEWPEIVAILPNRESFITGQKTVTTAGTAVQLPSVKIPDGFKVILIAMPANAGFIYLGNSKASVENVADRLNRLDAGDSIALQVTDLSTVWIDASVNGEGISYIVEQ